MRDKIIAGNWKMYTTPQQGVKLVQDLLVSIKDLKLDGKQVIVIPPFTHLSLIHNELNGNGKVSLGAQNCHFEKEGAMTGEVSPVMIKAIGCSHVVIGHSERRQYFGEGNDLLAKKVVSAIEEGLTAIYCCGETLSEREGNKHFDIVGSQISEGLFNLDAEKMKSVIVAYEPVWAIGTGKTASPEQAQEMHAFIRESFRKKFGNDIAGKLIILYGGSVKPNNAAELFSQGDIDGGLVGGASLKAADFAEIIKSA